MTHAHRVHMLGVTHAHRGSFGDKGEIIVLDGIDVFKSLGEAWGTCVPDTPRLPGAGFNYDPAMMRALMNYSLDQVRRVGSFV